MNSKKLKHCFTTLFVFCLIGVTVGLGDAMADEIDEPIVCNGDEIEYFEDEKKVVGTGNVIIEYKDTTLTCDKIIVWTETKEAQAEGNVRIVEGDNFFAGDSMTYNFEKESGTVVNFTGYTEPWYSRGESAERTGPDELIVTNGYVTSCDIEKEGGLPHYKISGRKVLVYPNVKVVIKDATMWLGRVPVLWIPVYSHPLDEDRPRVTVIPGKNNDWGAFLLTSWRYNLDSNHKGCVHLDYREKKDFAWGIDHTYNTSMLGKGILKTYYMHERNLMRDHIYTSSDKGAPTEEAERFMLHLRHKWQIWDDTLATAELYKAKDEDFRKDYFDSRYNNEYEKDPNPRSYLLITKTQPIYNLSILTEKRANRFETVQEKLPEIKLVINNNRIDRLFSSEFEDEHDGAESEMTTFQSIMNRGALYYSGEFSAVTLNAKYPRSTDENPISNVDSNYNNRYDTYNKLSYATKMSFLNITPYAAMRQTYYEKDTAESSSHLDGTFFTGVDISTKFYKIFSFMGSPFGMEINNLRHIITPSMGYSYNPASTQYGSDIYGFLGGNRNNSISLSLENKLQTKRGKDMESVDFARLGVSTSYDLAQQGSGRRFADYVVELELLPYDWLSITSNAVIDSHKRFRHLWLKETNTDFVASINKDLKLGMGHSYVNGETNNLHGELQWQIDKDWKVKAYESYDIKRLRHDQKKTHYFREQRYTISRDLHCWEMDLTYTVFKEKGEEIMLIFTLKALPNMPISYGRNYHEPKQGLQTYELPE